MAMNRNNNIPRGEPICRKDNCSPFDFGVVFNDIHSFSGPKKQELIENVWSPRSDPQFEFPKSVESSGRLRKFNPLWLQQFPWLVYSKYLDGAFCLPCVLFARACGRNSSKLDKLVKSPLTYWTTAIGRLLSHSNGSCEMHNASVIAMNNFLRCMRQQTIPINQQLDNLLQQQIAKNREIMKSLFKTVILCGRNNFALRGRRDDDPRNESLQGNFQALLTFRIDSGDRVLEEHLQNAPRNATYVSKTIQNEMIAVVGKFITDHLSREIRESRYFSILADEAADVSNKENLSVVIRYVDETKTIREEFLGFYLCEEGTAGVAIKNIIVKAVADLGLSMDDCRGQCYDGAGNMAGRLNGASSLITQSHPKAIYVHCMNHRLNLCVADTCSLQLVRNMMTNVRKISDFFHNSPKREQCLIAKVRELLPRNNHTVLIDVCKTRWVARIDGMDRIVEFLLPVVSLFEDIILGNEVQVDDNTRIGNWNANTKNDATSLLNSITFSFIVTLVIVRHILDLTRPLTLKLQRKEMDLLKAKDEIKRLKSDLTQMQTDIDARHHDLYVEAVNLARSVSVEPSMPRIVQRQVYRDNAPAINPEDYYKFNLTRVFLDHSLQQINSRFQDDVLVCYKGLSIIPTVLLENNLVWKKNVQEFVDHYRQDIPNIAGLDAELILWERMWKEQSTNGLEVPDRITTTLEVIDKQASVNTYTILQLLATIPISAASCERSISTLRYLKNYLRSTMGQVRLNGLALMYSHRDINLDLEKIVDLFANLHPRRMRMANILQDEAEQ